MTPMRRMFNRITIEDVTDHGDDTLKLLTVVSPPRVTPMTASVDLN